MNTCVKIRSINKCVKKYGNIFWLVDVLLKLMSKLILKYYHGGYEGNPEGCILFLVVYLKVLV